MTADRKLPWGAGVVNQLGSAKARGFRVSGAGEGSTVAEAFTKAGLDWDVMKLPLYAATRGYPWGDEVVTADGSITQANAEWHPDPHSLNRFPDKFVITRSDNYAPLGIVGNVYEPVQNSRTASFLSTVVDSTRSEQIAAGMTGNGERIWGVVKLNEQMVVGGLEQEAVDTYLLATTTHNGTAKWRASVIPVRLACTNGMRVVMRNAVSSWSIRHTSGIHWEIEEAQRALGLTHLYLDEWQTTMNRLYERPLLQAGFDALLNHLAPNPLRPSVDKPEKVHKRYERQLIKARTIRAEIQKLYEEADEFNQIRGTEYGALSAVNGWELWQSPVRGLRNNIRAEWQLGKLLDEDEPPYTRKAARLLVGGGIER